MPVKHLAERAAVDRGRLSSFEAGKVDPEETWIRRVETALDQLEHEMSPAPGEDGGDIVEFLIEGNFGVRAAVKGPIRDIDKLREAAAQFARELQGDPSSQDS